MKQQQAPEKEISVSSPHQETATPIALLKSQSLKGLLCPRL